MHRVTNVLLALIFGALLAIWARLPGGLAVAAEEAASRRPAFADVGFAVDNGGFYILDPVKNQLFRYNRRGRVLQVYDVRELGQDFKVSYGTEP